MNKNYQAANKDLTGVVLVGGKSKRMGMPKAILDIDGEKLFIRTAELLRSFTSEVYISGRQDQLSFLDPMPFPFIEDRYDHIGPVAGLISAYEFFHPVEKGFLFAATDMPLLDRDVLELLIEERNREKLATMFRHKDSGFLEPLCAIYEPAAEKKIKKAIQNEKYSIHKIFELSEIHSIEFDELRGLTNLNFPEQLLDL